MSPHPPPPPGFLLTSVIFHIRYSAQLEILVSFLQLYSLMVKAHCIACLHRTRPLRYDSRSSTSAYPPILAVGRVQVALCFRINFPSLWDQVRA